MKILFRDFTAQQRKEAARKGTAMPDGSFPIENEEDLHNAVRLAGKARNPEAARRHIMERARAMGMESAIPDDWKSGKGAKKSKMAAFDMEPFSHALDAIHQQTVDGDRIVRKGKFFEVGEYEDKAFSLSEDEADAAIASFEPAPINVEHMPSFLDGKLGRVTKLWRDGKDILAEYVIPKWLHEVTKAEPLKVSSEWDRAEKKAVGAAIVLHPRVADAAIMAAFSAEFARFANHDTMHGQAKLQLIHDMAAASGARCQMPGKASYTAAHEAKAFQAIHDLTLQHGADCDSASMIPVAAYTDDELSPGPIESGKEDTHLKFSLRDLLNGVRDKNADPDAVEIEIPELVQGTPLMVPARKAEMSDEDKASFSEMKSTIATMSKQIEQLVAVNADLKETNDALKAEMSESKKSAQLEVDRAYIASFVKSGRVTPAEAKVYETLASENPAAFAAVKPTLEARPVHVVFGGKPTVTDAREVIAKMGTSEQAESALNEKTREIMRRDNADYMAAFKQARLENPDLVRAYMEQRDAVARMGGDN